MFRSGRRGGGGGGAARGRRAAIPLAQGQAACARAPLPAQRATCTLCACAALQDDFLIHLLTTTIIIEQFIIKYTKKILIHKISVFSRIQICRKCRYNKFIFYASNKKSILFWVIN